MYKTFVSRTNIVVHVLLIAGIFFSAVTTAVAVSNPTPPGVTTPVPSGTGQAMVPPSALSPEEPMLLGSGGNQCPTPPTTATELYCCQWSRGLNAYRWVICRGEGCLASGTKVKLGDGTLKPVDTLGVGDMVLNPVTGSAMKIAKVVAGPEKEPLIEIATKGATVRVTQLHPVLTEAGVKKAIDVRISDKVQLENGKFEELTSLRQVTEELGEQVVWNLRFENESDDYKQHLILTDGIVTGDLSLQEKLSASDKK